MSWYKMSNQNEFYDWLKYALQKGTTGMDPVMLNCIIDDYLYKLDPWSSDRDNPLGFGWD